jgi:hypothetical protein
VLKMQSIIYKWPKKYERTFIVYSVFRVKMITPKTAFLKKLILIFFLPFTQSAFAQDSCNCLLNLNHMIEKVSLNYAGYKDKVKPVTQQRYSALIDSLRKTAGTTNDLTCYLLLDRYRLFFLDKHLQLRGNLPPAENNATDASAAPVQTEWTKDKIYYYLTKNKLTPLEGIWKTEGYEIGVVLNKKSREYEAIIISAENKNWKEGMLKFSSTPQYKNSFVTAYRMGNFSIDTTTTVLNKNFIEIQRFGSWQKMFPAVKDSFAKAVYSTMFGGQVQLRVLDAATLYIALKSCDLANKPILDSLLKANATMLKTIPNWIVDFRGNGGGSTDVFQSLLPFFYTKTLHDKGDKHWMTPDQTAAFKKFTEENKALMDTATLNYLNKIIRFGEANPNGWHDSGSDSLKYEKVLAFPKRVAVLSDRNNGSSGETFLLTVKGLSDKVTVFGENSAGYMDYGDLQEFTFPCKKLMMYIPSRRSNYLDDGITYSYTGIPPDIFIPASTKDWIGFVVDYWKKNK